MLARAETPTALQRKFMRPTARDHRYGSSPGRAMEATPSVIPSPASTWMSPVPAVSAARRHRSGPEMEPAPKNGRLLRVEPTIRSSPTVLEKRWMSPAVSSPLAQNSRSGSETTPTPTPATSQTSHLHPPRPRPPATVAGGPYRLKTPGGMALDVASGQLTNGAAAQIYTDNGTGAQAWQFTRQPDGTYTIRNPQSDKYLDVAGASGINGGKVQIWTGNGTCAQKWSLTAQNNNYILVSSCSGKVLDVAGGGTAPGTRVQIWGQNGTGAQSWTLTSLPPPAPPRSTSPRDNAFIGGTYRLKTPWGMALDVTASSRTMGTPVQTWNENGTGAQEWQVTRQTDGFYTLRNPGSDMYLDVRGGSTQSGTGVQIWPGNATCAQKWDIVPNGTGFALLSACSQNTSQKAALDVTAANPAAGTRVQIWVQNSTPAQTWTFAATG